ncbi:cytochrome P450 oxidoreductase [Thozetella sp. PMI_491]|nr:cytochrome P450 oxidoreductase [Thozetella sp. PMI_491]
MAQSATVLGLLREYWLLALPATFFAYLLFQRFRQGLNRVPGPFLNSVSPIPRVLSVWRGRCHEDDIVLHRKYGKIVRLAPTIFSVSDQAEVNQLYGIGTKFQKSGFYELSEAYDEQGLIPDPFILNDRELHTRMKRNAANAYSMNGLVQMEPWIEPVTERLLRRLGEAADKKGSVDLGAEIANYTMDAVCALTFGRDFDYMSNGDVLGIHKMMKIASWYMAVFGQISWTHRYLLRHQFFATLLFGSDQPLGSADTINVVNAELDKARSMSEEPAYMTFLQRLIFNQKSNPKSLDDREIMTHAWGNSTAGSDTTATAMRGVIYYLLRHPDVKQKLLKEIKDAGLKVPVGYTEANNIEYLKAVIKEGMRLHPSVGMILGRIVPPGGAVICGHKLPAGAEVGLNPWIVHRDPEVFPSPERFWPERWLPSQTGEDQLKAMNRAFLTFGHGAHTCSGRWISLMETTKLIPTLLLEFDMELKDGGKGYRFENFWFTMQEGLDVVIKRKKE